MPSHGSTRRSNRRRGCVLIDMKQRVMTYRAGAPIVDPDVW